MSVITQAPSADVSRHPDVFVSRTLGAPIPTPITTLRSAPETSSIDGYTPPAPPRASCTARAVAPSPITNRLSCRTWQTTSSSGERASRLLSGSGRSTAGLGSFSADVELKLNSLAGARSAVEPSSVERQLVSTGTRKALDATSPGSWRGYQTGTSGP